MTFEDENSTKKQPDDHLGSDNTQALTFEAHHQESDTSESKSDPDCLQAEGLARPEDEVNRKHLKQLEEQHSNLIQRSLALESEIRDFELRNSELIEWADKYRKSFLSRTLLRLKSELKSSQETLAHYSQLVRTFTLPEIGVLARARRSFHRTLLIVNSLIIGVSALLWNAPVIVDSLSRIQVFSRLADWTNFPSHSSILFYGLGLSLLTLSTELIRYYNVWSSFSRKVNLLLWELDLVARNTDHCRSENSRLSNLYPQVKDWLEILGNSINVPWKIREEWLKSNNRDLSLDDAPFALHVAQAEENDSVASKALRRDAMERHLRRGWREEVFTIQVEAIRKSLGLPSERLTVESLDRDISFSPGGPRQMVKMNMTKSDPLEAVARSQLLPLMNVVQTESVTQARPPVFEMRTNPLDEISEDDMGLEGVQKVAWDSFLKLSLTTTGRSRTPLSVLAFSSSGKQAGHADRTQTIFQGPERVISECSDEEAITKPYSAQAKLPLDILIRVDIAGPIPREHLHIAQVTKEELSQFEVEYEKQIQSGRGNWKSGT